MKFTNAKRRKTRKESHTIDSSGIPLRKEHSNSNYLHIILPAFLIILFVKSFSENIFPITIKNTADLFSARYYKDNLRQM